MSNEFLDAVAADPELSDYITKMIDQTLMIAQPVLDAAARVREIQEQQKFAQGNLSSREQYRLAVEHRDLIENLLISVETGVVVNPD
jgi:L-rhamnose isomerase